MPSGSGHQRQAPPARPVLVEQWPDLVPRPALEGHRVAVDRQPGGVQRGEDPLQASVVVPGWLVVAGEVGRVRGGSRPRCSDRSRHGGQEPVGELVQQVGDEFDPAGSVRRDEESEVAVRDQQQQALEALPAAVVGQCAVPGNGALPESVGVSVQVGVGTERPLMHQRERGRVQYCGGGTGESSCRRSGFAIKVSDHEVGHVRGRRTDRAVRWQPVEDERDLPIARVSPNVGVRGIGRQRRWDRLERRGVTHPQPIQDVALDVVAPGLPGHRREDLPGQPGTVVRIRGGDAGGRGRPHAPGSEPHRAPGRPGGTDQCGQARGWPVRDCHRHRDHRSGPGRGVEPTGERNPGCLRLFGDDVARQGFRPGRAG